MSQSLGHPRPPRRALSSEEAYDSIVSTARSLRLRGMLMLSEQNRAREAAAILEEVPLSSKRRRYQEFLYRVHASCGPHAMLLCAVGLGQHRALTMRKTDRKDLIEMLRKSKDQGPLDYEVLRSLAAAQGIPSSVEADVEIDQDQRTLQGEGQVLPMLPLINTACLTFQDDSRIASDRLASSCLFAEQEQETENQCQSGGVYTLLSEEDLEIGRCHSHDASATLAQIESMDRIALKSPSTQKLLESASLEGVRTIFGEKMCGLIRQVTVQTSESNRHRSSITATLSRTGSIDLLLSLDVYEWGVEDLAMALFNAKITWLKQATHVVFHNGITLVVPDSEVTLRGVNDSAIDTTFGWEIRNAINQSPVRIKELQEGKDVTECISMIFSRTGAIINFSLGLDSGLAIIDKLNW